MAETQNVQQALTNSRVLNRGDITFFNGGTSPTQGPTQVRKFLLFYIAF